MTSETQGNQSQSQPMPTPASAELAIAAINSLRTEFAIRLAAVDTRFEAMDRAVSLQHDDYVRVPTLLDRAINDLKQLIAKQFDTVGANLKNLSDVTAERLASVQVQFSLLGKASEQIDTANKASIALALQAQKEGSVSTVQMIVAAMAKMEANFTKQIEQGQILVNEVKRNTDERINDIKGRIDRGEGRTSVTDPAVGAALAELSNGIKLLATKPAEGSKDSWTVAAIAVGVVAVLIVIALTVYSNTGRTNNVRPTVYQTVQNEETDRPPPTPPIVKFLVQTKPGGRPTPFSEPSDTLEECLADTNEILRRAANAATPGRVQAGCVVTIEPDASRS